MAPLRPTSGAPREGLDGLPGGGLNVAHEAAGRHAASERRGQVALRWTEAEGIVGEMTFGELERLTRRFANVLEGLSIEPGERVLAMMHELPELFVTALGALRYGAVFGLVPRGLSAESLRAHLSSAEARVLVTTTSEYERSVRWLRDSVGTLDHVILLGDDRGETNVDHTLDWIGLVHDTEAAHRIAETDAEAPAIVCFSEQGGAEPECCVHSHVEVLEHHLDDTACCATAGSFLERLGPLTRGETVLLAPKG